MHSFVNNGLVDVHVDPLPQATTIVDVEIGVVLVVLGNARGTGHHAPAPQFPHHYHLHLLIYCLVAEELLQLHHIAAGNCRK